MLNIKMLSKYGRKILDKTCLDTKHTIKNCWQADMFGIPENYSIGNRLIILYMGSKNGFIEWSKASVQGQ